MLEIKRTSPIIALIGALALLSSTPTFAQTAAPASNTAAAPAASANSDSDSGPAPAVDAETLKVGGKSAGKATPITMFMAAELPVKVIMIGLLLCSIFSWTLLVIKLVEFSSLKRSSDRFLEAFRGAKTINEMGKIAESEEHAGNPMADMAAAAASEVELSRQAGLNVSGEYRGSTLSRAGTAIGAVQASLARRLSGGMQFLASVGSNAPFVGLLGTVYGIMNSFIGIANTNTTSLAVVAPGIAQALLATGIGLFAAIPSVVFYNYFQTQISSYGSRSEGFVAELMNAVSRHLDKGV